MANQFRYVRGDTQALQLPTYGTDTIEVGDLVWWDATNNAVRNAETVGGADYAAKKGNFAAAFLGVAMEAKSAAEANKQILVATAGDFQYECPSGAEYDVLDTVAIGNGTAVSDQSVVKDTTAANAIGRVIALKPSTAATVVIRLLSKTSR